MAWAPKPDVDPYGTLRSLVPVHRGRAYGGKVLHNLKDTLKTLQLQSKGVADFESIQAVQYLSVQVNALQKGFLTLSDALLEELESVKQERDSLATTLNEIRHDDSRKMADMQQRFDHMYALMQDCQNNTHSSTRDECARVSAKIEILEQRQAAAAQQASEAAHTHSLQTKQLEQSVEDHQQRLVTSVNKAESRGREAAEQIAQRAVADSQISMQEACECMARDMIDNLVPPMVERIVAQRLRESVKEQGGLIYKDMLSLRADLAHLRQEGESASSLTSAVAVSASTLAEDVRQLAHWCRSADEAREQQEGRLDQLERVPPLQAQLKALQDRVTTASKNQGRHAQSVEDIIRALVMDTAALSRQSKSLDGQLANIKHLSERTQGQLVRSSWVFSNALGIPSPLADTASER
ncbi:hypothetical protein WJX82_006128 [Trebouxia sp. C0006]